MLLASLVSWAGFLLQAQLATDEPGEKKKLELFLRQAQIVEVDKNLVGGRTAPWIVTLDDGKTRQRAIFKHIDSRRPQIPPDSYKYELAAYELAQILGVDFVPPVVEREVSGRKGSLQLFLENCLKEKDRRRKKVSPPDARRFTDSLEEIRVFENLVSDLCQDADDIWIHKETWMVWRVDFSEAFTPSAELLPGCEISRCSEKLFSRLLETKDEVLISAMKPYLNKAEIEALLERKNLILQKIQKLIEEKGKDAVLFSEDR